MRTLLVAALLLGWLEAAQPATPRMSVRQPEAEEPVRVEVFVDRSAAVALGPRGRRLEQTRQLVVYRLDALAQLDQRLGHGLSKVPHVAAAQLRQRMTGHTAALTLAWRDALGAELRAAALGIRQVPAVVFDGQLIVYGPADLEQAWTQWRRVVEEARR